MCPIIKTLKRVLLIIPRGHIPRCTCVGERALFWTDQKNLLHLSTFSTEKHLRLHPFYMPISCNIPGLRPLLHIPFCELNVSCLVSTKLHSLIILSPLSHYPFYAPFVTIISIRVRGGPVKPAPAGLRRPNDCCTAFR